MEETKRCPYCGEEILTTAKKCRHCGEWLENKPGAHAQLSARTGKGTDAHGQQATDSERFFVYYFNTVWNSKKDTKHFIIPSFDFSGRLPRKRFWMGVLLIMLTWVPVLNCLFCLFATYTTFVQILIGVFYILLVAKLVEMHVRRLNDIGKSGWLVLLHLVPIANLYLLYLLCQKGSDCEPTQWTKRDNVDVALIAFIIVIAIIIQNVLAPALYY